MNCLKRLFTRVETIAHPASGWLRSGAGTPAKKKSKKASHYTVAHPSPDSFNVRGNWGKKNDNPRCTPAP